MEPEQTWLKQVTVEVAPVAGKRKERPRHARFSYGYFD
jgi:hypothetical protein